MKATDIYGLFEAQQELFEVEMSPSNLRKLASAIPGVQVGMEFEMVVPDVQNTDDDDFEAEPDYDRDERVEDIEDIIRFFGEEDDYMGQQNSPRQLDRLRDELSEMFYEWQGEQILRSWKDEDGKKYFRKWVAENVDPDEIAEFANTPDDLFGNKDPSPDDYDSFIDDQWYTEGSYYDEAYDAYRDEKIDEGDFSESDFLESADINHMSDVPRQVRSDIYWPYYTEPYSEGGGEDIESVADEFSDAIGKRVYSSTNYHGARRAPDAYSLEPDSSIDASSGEAGLEFISPPQDVDEMLEDLKKVKKWADKRGAYTNRSTGLHINVSLPDFSSDKLDFVKLAVLLGDKYVLEQFGRLSNSYARSALDIIKDRAKDNEDVDRLLKQLKGNVETIASKILHSGRTDKYTSINNKGNYIEFRSAGGDWLNKNFDKIEDTLLRYVVALDAACDPDKYKKEYLKGLYKVLKPKDPKSDLSMFARYMSGEITRNEYAETLEKQRKERFRDQGIRILQKDEVEENDWEITYDDGKKSDTIYIANTEKVNNDEAAFKAAQKFKPQWFKPDTVEYISVKPFKFGPELDDLKLYRAEYGHKYTSVVAENEEQAKEYLKIMDPEYFSGNSNVEITLTDENASKRQISQMIDWQENKLKTGREFVTRPKIWRSSGPGQNSSRYYIAAVTREEAIDVVKDLDPDMVESDRFDIYISDAYPDDDTYEAYRKAQADLIRVRQEERARLHAQQAERDDEIDISNLTTYRVSNLNGYNYYVAENGAEAAELAHILEPEKFPNIADITVQDQSGSAATSNPLLMRGMYKRQQEQLSNLRQVQFNTYYVSNSRVGGTNQVSARSEQEAIDIATRENPTWVAADLQVSQPREEQQYTGYRVTGSNSSEQIIAARSPGEAQRIAMLLYPNLGDNLNVSATTMSPELAASRYQRHQEDLARMNAPALVQQYTGFRVTGSNASDEIIAARTAEEAENIARLLYPNLGDNLSVAVTDMPPLAAALRYRRHQENIANSTSSSSNTRISDLRYYRVVRQDASGRADVAASSPEDAMNRVRQQNPTWANSPLRAELL